MLQQSAGREQDAYVGRSGPNVEIVSCTLQPAPVHDTRPNGSVQNCTCGLLIGKPAAFMAASAAAANELSACDGLLFLICFGSAGFKACLPLACAIKQ